MSEQTNEDGVVKLVGAGVPADQGLSSLGLLMQLAGNVLAAMFALFTLASLFALRTGGETMWVIVLLGMCVARSLIHRMAGAQLLYGNGALREDGKQDRVGGIRTYLIFSAVQIAVTGLLMKFKFEAELRPTVAILLALAAWPVALAVLMQLPRFKRYKDDLPITEDKGFEGASIMMTVLGLCGAVASGTFLLFLLDLPGRALQKGGGILVVLALGMLVVRSILHVQAGIAGLRETSVDRSVELANRYANFGVISSFCAAGAMLLFFMTSREGFVGMAFVCGICWMLMTWPLIIRRFFSDRQFADLLAGDQADIHRRAPDAGLTGLGWLLFGQAFFSGSFLIIEIVGGTGRAATGQLEMMMSMFGGGAMRSIWWSVGIVVLQGWAGYELVRMSPQSRIIATVYGVVGSAVTLYINWPLIKMLKSAGGIFRDSSALQIGPIAIALIIPVATVVLVNRKIAPTARARFRKPAAPAPQA